MNRQMNKQRLKQLSDSLQKGALISPSGLGVYIKQVRDALGMTQRQMAKHLKVSAPTLNKIEKHIESSSIKTITHVLAALNLNLMFSLSVSEPLEKTVRSRAALKAKQALDRVYGTMALEKQAPSGKNYDDRLKELTEEYALHPGSFLWED